MVTVPAPKIQVSLEQGVFKGAANADTAPATLPALESDDYGERLLAISRRIEGTSGLIMCHICGRSRHGVDEPMLLPETEEGALRAGWRYDEEDRWMCSECLGGL